MAKFVRTPTYVAGGLTEDEKVAMAAHTQKWVANALSTEPVEPARLTAAIRSLYRVTGQKQPRVVIVPSPLVMAFAGGFAAAIWESRKRGAVTDTKRGAVTDTNSATNDATYQATRGATYTAADSTIRDAVGTATRATRRGAPSVTTDVAIDRATRVTDVATCDAIDAATQWALYTAILGSADVNTHGATYNVTRSITVPLTEATTYRALSTATKVGCDTFRKLAHEIWKNFGVDPGLMLSRAANWSDVCQGGNMWSSWTCYLSAFRDILGLRLPVYEKYKAWEDCAIEGGLRIMHDEFCIVSDRPEILKIDEQHRPHCADGPSHRWRDGWSLYHWHGTSIPSEWVTGRPPSAQEALTWPNIEQRRAACEIVGWSKILKQLSARVIDEDTDPMIGTLLEVDLPDVGTERFLRVRCGTGREFALPVDPQCKTARQANLASFRLPDDPSLIPRVRT